MQFDRDASGKLNPLPKPSIDTGAGLERLAAVLQGRISNYETDLFEPLIARATSLTFPDSDKNALSDLMSGSEHQASLRIIADHSRATTFLISDGVLPSNEGRGYVLRKIMRRAIRHGRMLRRAQPFLYEMVYAVRDLMEDAYPELRESADHVAKIVVEEEKRFAHTLDIGLGKLESDLAPLIAEKRLSKEPEKGLEHLGLDKSQWGTLEPRDFPIYSGEKAFKLYDTFGLPRDFIEDACRDAGIGFDALGFDRAMGEQRERARASWRGAAKQTANPVYQKLPRSVFEGYDRTRSDNCEVLAITRAGRHQPKGGPFAPGTKFDTSPAPEEIGLSAPELKPGQEGEIILDHTPFYAESGGQVGDRGWLYSDDHNNVVAEVKGCYSPVQGVRAHQVIAKQTIRVGDKVDAVVNTDIRQSTMRNHTATHLLHAGLREILGKHVKQAGSLVAPNHLRFDFSHFTGVEDEELQDIEDLINKEVLRNEKVEVIENVPIDVAINEYRAMALFGEKYGDKVRVIKIGDFSTELCGGTHTDATGEIGLIKVLKEGSVSSGVRRIEAVTGEGSLHHFQEDHRLEGVVAGLASWAEALSPAKALKLEIDKRDAEIKRLQRELEQARMKSASSTITSANENVKDVRGVKVLAHRVDNLERAQMRTLVDQLRDKLGSGVVVLGSASDGRVALIVGVTKDLTSRVQAGKVIGPVAQKVGGSGGGRPDMAEAGGKNPEALDAALAGVYDVVDSLLK
jgi:alanyl-tRNA synthetase